MACLDSKKMVVLNVHYLFFKSKIKKLNEIKKAELNFN